jgi:hypothetical protein
MGVFKVFLKSMAAVDSAALQAGAQRLKRYVDKILGHMSPQTFSHSTVLFDPNYGDVGARDLLVYLVQASILRNWAAYNQIEIVGGHIGAGGATAPFAQGVLSEVYVPTITRHGKTPAEQGVVLANLAIHEMAHNKHQFLAGIDPLLEVHTNCGGGLMAGNVMPALLRTGDLTDANAKPLAKVFGRDVNQFRAYLYSEEAGY